MPLQPASRLGAYEIVALIGAGGMGEVYRARDTRLKRDVAIKVLPDAFASDSERLARFQREAELLATLNHPNIAQIFGLEDRALVLELVDGPTLADRIAQGPIPLDEALPIAEQIAEALEAAHEQGIIHRDLKPANIKLTPDGKVKVLDFGLAKAMEQTPGSGLQVSGVSQSPTITSPAMTLAGVILGTAAYMSPEQAKGRSVDKRADIWAFGCVLYEMLTGRRAFDGEDVTDTIAAVVSKDVDWSRLPAATGTGVRRLLTRCLMKDRARRLRDIGDVHHDLSDEARPDLAIAAGSTHWSRYARFALVAAPVLAAFLAIPAVSHWREPARTPRPLRLTIEAPAESIRLLSPEISPDGRTVVFSTITAGRRGPALWIRHLSDAAPTMIANAPPANGAAFWSHDGRMVAYPVGQSLVQVDLASNTTRTLAKLSTTLAGIARFGGTWSAQGVVLFGIGSTIFQLPAGGGEAKPLTFDGLTAESDHRLPVFLPDGRRFLFLSSAPGGESHIYLGSLGGGPVTRLFAAESQAMYAEPSPGRGYVLYVHDSNLLAQPFELGTARPHGEAFVVASAVPTYSAEFGGTGRGMFSVSPDGVLVYSSQTDSATQRLTWFDRAGKELGMLGPPALYHGPRISPNGHRVAVAKLDPRTRFGDIYIIDEDGTEQRLTFDPANDIQPVWETNGSHVIWSSHRNGKSQLYRKRADGGGSEELLHESAHHVAPDDVSHDGRLVVFGESHPVTRNDLWVLPLDGNGPARPILNTPADEPRARFSPDGKLIGYISDGQAYVQTFPDMTAKWQVTGPGGGVPQWRQDGKEMYHTGASLVARAVVSTVPLRLGEPVALFTPPIVQRGSFFHASADGKRFLFAVDPVRASTLRYHIAFDWADEVASSLVGAPAPR